SQSFQTQQQPKPSTLEETSMDNNNRLNTRLQQNHNFEHGQQNDENQQSSQNKGNNQIHQNFIQSGTSLTDSERSPVTKEQTFSQSVENQQWTPTYSLHSSTDSNNVQLQNLPQSNPVFGTQQWLNQIPEREPQDYHHTFTQSTQGSHTTQNQQQLQNFPNQNHEKPIQLSQNKFLTQQFQNQPIKSEFDDHHIAFQLQPWQKISKHSLILKPQLRLQNQYKKSSIADTSSQIPNSQYGLDQQQQQDLLNENSFEHMQSGSNNQQYQNPTSQWKDFDDSKLQTTHGFATNPLVPWHIQPWSQTGQLHANSFETMRKPNKNIRPVEDLHQWQSSRTVEQQHQPNYNQIKQQQAQDSLPTLSSGSWYY
ncbi:unnamed protein product, partial [Rotaria sp. Silwood1]